MTQATAASVAMQRRASAVRAAALAGCVLALSAFAVGLWLGQAIDGTLAPMALAVAFGGLATALVAWTLVQWHGERKAA
ncbi:MAG: hypothetical protein Q8L49_18480 [Burkholderiaceae bacterium]|nr:hypothetical protein [Burkholderiaceae bacterium]